MERIMKHCGTERIETDRIILRRFSPEDAEAMYQNWAFDAEVTEFLTWPAHTSAEVSKASLEEWTAAYSRYEGTLRESDRNNQGICDACWYAILRSEYRSRH